MRDNLEQFNKKLKAALNMSHPSKPYISLNLLGEFLTTNPKRQRRILEQLKYPDDNKYPYVGNEAKEAIKKYILKDFDEKVLNKCIKQYQGKEGSSASTQGQIDSSIEGLELVLNGNADINSSYTYTEYKGDNPKLTIQGVEVSVNPDLIIRFTSRNVNYVGALKIHLSKSSPIKELGGKYITTILYYFVDKYIKQDNESVKEKYCLSFDVHTDSIIECPKGVKNRWNEIEAGCMNIAAIWDTI